MPDNENENLLATQDLEDSVSIDNLTQSPDLDGDDVIVMVHENNGVKSTYKAILRSIANFINKLLHYSSDLHTQNDTIIGAINELADGGSGSADITTEITTPASIQTFEDGGDNIPLKSCVVFIPENTQGISSVNIGVNGKNFYPLKVGRDLFTDNRSASHTTNDDILSITMDSQNNSGVYGGTGASINNQICQTIKKFSGEFVLSLNAKADADNKDVYFGFQSFYSSVVTLSTSWQRIELPMTLDGNIHILNFYNRSGSAITVDIKDVQIELGQTATEYEDYVGDNYSISLGETLTQGGTLEAVSGLLTRSDTTIKQLPYTRICTLSGLNNIYADTGNVNELEYFNDGANDIDSLIDLETKELRKGKKVKFDITASHPNNPTAYSIVVKVAGNSVFSKAYTCNTYGVFAEATDYFVYDGEIYTVVAQGFQASTNQKMLTFAINDESYDVKCSASNSSYATEDSFSLKVGEGVDASDVYYDNSTSGLTATNLQDAIDEIVSMMQ